MNHETSACHQLLLWVFKTQQQDPACLELRFTVCILRIYENTSHTYEIHEARLYRKIQNVYQTLSKVYRCVLNQYPIHISKKHTFPIILWLQSEPYGYGLFEHRLVTDPHLWSFLVGNHPFFWSTRLNHTFISAFEYVYINPIQPDLTISNLCLDEFSAFTKLTKDCRETRCVGHGLHDVGRVSSLHLGRQSSKESVNNKNRLPPVNVYIYTHVNIYT